MPATQPLNARTCPNCDLRLCDSEVADGWCDNCGTRLPRYITEPARMAPCAVPSGPPHRGAGKTTSLLAAGGLFLMAALELGGGLLLYGLLTSGRAGGDVPAGFVKVLLALTLAFSVLWAALGVFALFRPRAAALAGLIILVPLTALAVVSNPSLLHLFKVAVIVCLATTRARGEGR